MGRIGEDEIEALKASVPIEQLVRQSGVVLERKGRSLLGRCPFHDDRTPSLLLSPDKNLFHCKGACASGGSVIDWVMKAEGVGFRAAVEQLRGLKVSVRAKAEAKALRAPISLDAEDQALMLEVLAYYQETLKRTPEALEYLESRALGAGGMIDHFRIGYSDQSLLSAIPSKEGKAGAELHRRLSKLGLVAANGREHFMSSIVVPIFGADGALLELYGRRIHPAKASMPVHRYLPGPRSTRGVFNVEAFAQSKDLILCEALFDALSFWCAGFRGVTSAYGIEGFTDEMLAAMKAHDTERVLIAFDRDEAGDRGAEKVSERLLAAGIGCFRVEFPKGMDANEYARTLRPAERSLSLVLSKARRIGGGPNNHAYARPDLAALELATSTPASLPEAALPLAQARAPAPAIAEAEESPPFAADEPAPVTPTVEVDTEQRKEEVILRLGPRRYRVRGLSKNATVDLLKLNLLVSDGTRFFVDTLDLYSARQRAAFVKQAATELGVDEAAIKEDVGRVLLRLEALQAEAQKAALTTKAQTVELTEKEQAAALELLRDPRLLDRILADFELAGVVGEETNKLVAYLAAVSRKLEDPLAVIIQSSSSAGKSSLMEAVLAFMPEEDRVKYSAMTGQSLFYMGETALRQKILAIVEEEGAERASYALKLLQSERELTIASTGKDPSTGRLVTHTYRVEGPVMIFLTTTSAELDEELLNRAIVLSVDEERAQTQAIHRLQRRRETLAGLLAKKDKAELLTLHKNAQRMLRPVLVANPFAERLTFVDHQTRTRRDHMKYLALIRSLALLFQHQRPVHTVKRGDETLSYVEVTPFDLGIANRLADEVLGRSLDELPPKTRRLLAELRAYAAARAAAEKIPPSDVRFTRRDLRGVTGWRDTQLKVHLGRLVDLEYVLAWGQRGQRFQYTLLWDGRGEDGGRFVSGLLDPRALDGAGPGMPEQISDRSGSLAGWSAPGRPLVGGMSGPGRPDEIEETARADLALAAPAPLSPPKPRLGGAPKNGTTRLGMAGAIRAGVE